jgi:spore coat polysaccharide biosynthesis predicted glycosyltransferase SpsG/2-polyprenyl-3-methyl-5-hydroxy-6-metoxy-1,4-benzoquinol methylase
VKKIAIITEASPVNGMGHLIRMCSLYGAIKKEYNICFFVFGNKENSVYLAENNISFKHIENIESLLKEITVYSPDIILHDMRDSKKEVIKELSAVAKVISFDDAGEPFYAQALINALPLPRELNIKANYGGLKYVILNPDIDKYRKIYPSGRVNNILVSFGGADPAHLSEYVYKIFLELGLDVKIRFVLGPLYSGRSDFAPYESVATDNIFEMLKWADVVVTSFGMTLYEALYIGTFPVLINVSEYHNRLANTLDFNVNLGIGGSQRSFDDIKKGIFDAVNDVARRKSLFNVSKNIIDNKGISRIKEVIAEELERDKVICSVCKNDLLEVADRKGKDNIYFCMSCKTLCRDKNYSALINYNDNYFLDDYKKQYGKTYLEDKNNINLLNGKRLDIIDSLVNTKRKDKPLLELGCATGFFLECAKERGYAPEGIEISKYASSYCKYTAKLNVKQGDFLKFEYSKPVYEVISMWYFIEHIKNFKDVILKAYKIMRDGGIIALSTPNCFGISGRNNISEYASRIPGDHYNEFSPFSMTSVLEACGFKVEKVISGGIHYKRWLKNRTSPLLNNFVAESIYKKVAGARNLGDTFEIYARKI